MLSLTDVPRAGLVSPMGVAAAVARVGDGGCALEASVTELWRRAKLNRLASRAAAAPAAGAGVAVLTTALEDAALAMRSRADWPSAAAALLFTEVLRSEDMPVPAPATAVAASVDTGATASGRKGGGVVAMVAVVVARTAPNRAPRPLRPRQRAHGPSLRCRRDTLLVRSICLCSPDALHSHLLDLSLSFSPSSCTSLHAALKQTGLARGRSFHLVCLRAH